MCARSRRVIVSSPCKTPPNHSLNKDICYSGFQLYDITAMSSVKRSYDCAHSGGSRSYDTYARRAEFSGIDISLVPGRCFYAFWNNRAARMGGRPRSIWRKGYVIDLATGYFLLELAKIAKFALLKSISNSERKIETGKAIRKNARPVKTWGG